MGLRGAAEAGDNFTVLSTGLIPSWCAGRRIDTRLRAAILVAQEERGEPGGLKQEIHLKRMVCARTHRLRGRIHRMDAAYSAYCVVASGGG